MKLLGIRVFREQDPEFAWGPFGGWWWEPTSGDQIDPTGYITPLGAWLAGWRATHNNSKEQR